MILEWSSVICILGKQQVFQVIVYTEIGEPLIWIMEVTTQKICFLSKQQAFQVIVAYTEIGEPLI